jgi:nucleoid-associated protein YgaU
MAAGPAYPILDRVVAAPAPASTAVQAAPPTKAATGSSRPRDRGATRGNVVVVRPGDTLWGIAARSLPARHSDADIARAWPRWYAENRAVVGPDPGHLRPGEHLEAPHS